MKRIVLLLQNPALMPLSGGAAGAQQWQPIMDHSFGHTAWIEQVEVPVRTKLGKKTTRMKRVVKLVSFERPRAGEAGSQEGEANVQREPVVVTLDIPENVLKEACYIMLQPSMGAILIPSSKKNEIHKFQYA